MIPARLAEERRKLCMTCEARETCPVAFKAGFVDPSTCPLNKHPTLAERKIEWAWPSNIDALSGCCDRADSS